MTRDALEKWGELTKPYTAKSLPFYKRTTRKEFLEQFESNSISRNEEIFYNKFNYIYERWLDETLRIIAALM